MIGHVGRRGQIWWRDQREVLQATGASLRGRWPGLKASLRSGTTNAGRPNLNLKSHFEAWQDGTPSRQKRCGGLPSIKFRAKYLASFAFGLALLVVFILYSIRSHPKRFDVRRCPGRRFRHPRRIQRRQADGCGSVAAFGPSDYLDRRSKVLPTPRRRSLGNIAGRLAEFSGWQYAGGRKYHNTTACTPDVSYPGTDFPPKGPGSASCNLAGKPTQERRHPPAISEHGLFRSRRLRRGRRCQDISGRRPANSA